MWTLDKIIDQVQTPLPLVGVWSVSGGEVSVQLIERLLLEVGLLVYGVIIQPVRNLFKNGSGVSMQHEVPM